MQLTSRACAHCTTPLTNHHLPSLILHCPTTSSATSSACPARFCNRLCLKRSEKVHPLLCPAQNPASVPLVTFARKHTWMALHALAQCTARLLLAHQQKQGRQRAGISGRDSEEEGMREDWSVYCALADLGMEERVKGGWCVCAICAPLGIRLIVPRSSRPRHYHSQGCMVWSLTVLHGRLHTKPSRRRLWRRQIRFNRKNSPSY
jgi:hypothetical protein